MITAGRRRTGSHTFNMVTLLVDRHVDAGRGARTALVTPDGALTYQDLYRLMNRVGNGLKTLGVGPERRVVLLLADGPAFVASFLGAMRLGAVPVPVNTLAGTSDYEYVLNDSRATVLVAGAETMTKIDPIRARCPFLKHVIVDGGERPGAIAFGRLVDGQHDELPPASTHRDDPAYWLYSSGATGRPKGVVHRHRDMVSCISVYAREVLDLGADDLLFSISRLFFSYGLGNSLYLPLWAGASSLLVPDRPDAARALALIRRYRPTILFSVPTSYAALADVIESGTVDHDLRSLRLAISAGEPLPAPVLERWRQATGVELLDGLGSTEVGYIFISNRAGRVRPGSSGQPLSGYQVRIVDEARRDVAPGEVGSLLVKAESAAARYWHQPAKTRRTFLGKWLRTGDKYVRDADGYYTYAGREDDVFKVSGQWVFPLEVEQRLLAHPAVAECAVVGRPDERGLVKPHAYVVLKAGPPSEERARELTDFVAEELPAFKTPRRISFVGELPKTATGKIQRFRLRNGG